MVPRVTICSMPETRRPSKALHVENFPPELLRQAKSSAALQSTTLREWLIALVRWHLLTERPRNTVKPAARQKAPKP